MVRARIANGDLEGLDGMVVDALALPMFDVRAQPQAVAGYADWRLSGRIARLLRSGRFEGKPGEVLLMPSLGRIGAARIFLVGLGAPAAAKDVDLEAAVRMLADAAMRVVAVGTPTAPETRTDRELPVAMAERWLTALKGRGDTFQSLLLLDSGGALADGRDRLKKAAQAAGVSWEG